MYGFSACCRESLRRRFTSSCWTLVRDMFGSDRTSGSKYWRSCSERSWASIFVFSSRQYWRRSASWQYRTVRRIKTELPSNRYWELPRSSASFQRWRLRQHWWRCCKSVSSVPRRVIKGFSWRQPCRGRRRQSPPVKQQQSLLYLNNIGCFLRGYRSPASLHRWTIQADDHTW